ncbi:MAG: hypothetical protein CSA25_01985 [Desulfobacter postgatei]|uniref:Uncharacterized protein n=1 Tax=Desulfobacter postgatei TaxID=2293 RepID=A0A2G6MSX5_9BACT|nr:MAG: hypothetical protein CSA25_01985 [Desulfobacter postgatei]
MNNRVFIVLIVAILAGLYFILHSFAPVAFDQLKAALVSVEELFIWSSIAVGAVTALLFYAFGGKYRIWGTGLGIAITSMGVLLLIKPALGAKLLDVMLAAVLMGSGIFKLIRISRIHPQRLKWVAICSGAVSIIVACVAVFHFFNTDTYELITFLAIDFFISIFIVLQLAFSEKKEQSRSPQRN